jgi:hypothetical protein
VIKPALLSACLVATMMAAPGPGAAHTRRERPASVWETDPPRDGVQAVCGAVFNDGALAAQHVRLLVEQLDGVGNVVRRRDLEVLGEVPSGGRSYFCVPEPTGPGTYTYRLQVIGADPMATSGQERPQ